MARVTLQTIADQLGVSRMTVSNAFSRPDQLSTELRQRILDTAADLGYVGPDPAGRALARGTTGAVGVVLTDSLQYAFTDEVATGFLAAVADELAETGLALTLLTSNGRDDDVIPARDVAIDGALVYSCQSDSVIRRWLVRRKLPLVMVDQDPVAGVPSVNVDDRAGARAAAQHLVDLGHRRVAIVTLAIEGETGIFTDPPGKVEGHPTRERLLGWLDVLNSVGIDPTVVQASSNAENDAQQAARVVLVLDGATDGDPVLLRRPGARGDALRRGARPPRPRRSLGRRLRRQSRGTSRPPGADHRAPGRAGQGTACRVGARHGHRPGQGRDQASGPPPARADRARRARQHGTAT